MLVVPFNSFCILHIPCTVLTVDQWCTQMPLTPCAHHKIGGQTFGYLPIWWATLCCLNLHFPLKSEVEPDSVYIKVIFKFFFILVWGTQCVLGILALCSIGCNYFFPSVILPRLWSWWLMPHTRLPVPDHGLVFPPIKSTVCLTGVFYCFPHIDGAHFYLFAICMGSYLLLRILIYCFF